MKNSNIKQFNRAFTVVELVITITLFGLVTGLVLSFIDFLTRFNNQNIYEQQKIVQTDDFRKETDLWFSFFDKRDIIITLGHKQSTYLVYTENTTKPDEHFYIRIVSSTDEKDRLVKTAYFTYPANAMRGDINAAGLSEVKINVSNFSKVNVYEYPDGYSEDLESGFTALRFVEFLKVTQKRFACEILYL